MTDVTPRPAASVVLIREGLSEPIEVYMIRRSQGLRFLGGFYAFPGGKVDDGDAAPESLSLCLGAIPETREAGSPFWDGLPAAAFGVAAIRELFEETGILMACNSTGELIEITEGKLANRIRNWREILIANSENLTTLLASARWFYDLNSLRYLSHFTTPASSPIRFSARFFLAPVPPGQAPCLFPEETMEGFWIGVEEGYRRFQAGELPMAEPAEYTLGYLAQFEDCLALRRWHHDGRHKFHGIVDRIEFYGEGYDWKTGTWKANKPFWHP